jgi:hypothetical protein
MVRFVKPPDLVGTLRRTTKARAPAITQGVRNLGGQETAFDAGVAAIGQVITWFHRASQRHMVVHSDSMSAIARASHLALDQARVGPGIFGKWCANCDIGVKPST